MRTPLRQRISGLLAIGCVLGYVAQSGAKSYGSHSHSYSSHSSSHSYGSSHSYSSGPSHSSGGGSSHSSGGKSYSPGGGHTYGSGPSKSGGDSHSYTSSKSYGSGGGPARSPSPAPSSAPGKSYSSPSTPPSTRPSSAGSDKGFSFDQAAARAQKEQSSKRDFTQYKDSQNPGAGGTHDVRPPPVPSSSGWSRTTTYIPTRQVIITRPVRIYSVFNPYYSRPWVVYSDPYSSLFWWWLLDRSIDDRAWWAYHHRYDMDPARYDALLAADQQLSARVADLEAQQAVRDPSYTPPGLDRDLMYSDHYVSNSYSNRPTFLGVAAFRILIIGGGAALCFVFVWLIWIKRWQTAT